METANELVGRLHFLWLIGFGRKADNDDDEDEEEFESVIFQGAVNGTVALVAGNVVFTPPGNYSGPASFTYTVSDGLNTATATVSVTVNNLNDAPVANPDGPLPATEDTPLAISHASLLTNDADVDGDVLVIANFNVQGLAGTLTLGERSDRTGAVATLRLPR